MQAIRPSLSFDACACMSRPTGALYLSSIMLVFRA